MPTSRWRCCPTRRSSVSARGNSPPSKRPRRISWTAPLFVSGLGASPRPLPNEPSSPPAAGCSAVAPQVPCLRSADSPLAGPHDSITQGEAVARWKIAGISFEHFHMGDNLQRIVDHPDAELVGICDPQADRMQEAIETFSVPAERVFTDYAECL